MNCSKEMYLSTEFLNEYKLAIITSVEYENVDGKVYTKVNKDLQSWANHLCRVTRAFNEDNGLLYETILLPADWEEMTHTDKVKMYQFLRENTILDKSILISNRTNSIVSKLRDKIEEGVIKTTTDITEHIERMEGLWKSV